MPKIDVTHSCSHVQVHKIRANGKDDHKLAIWRGRPCSSCESEAFEKERLEELMSRPLAPNLGKRSKYRGRFERYGEKSSFRGPPKTTLLLLDVRDAAGNQVREHLWMNMTRGFAAIELKQGDEVEFYATVTTYERGYRGRRLDVEAGFGVDFRLSRPTKIRLVGSKEDGSA